MADYIWHFFYLPNVYRGGLRPQGGEMLLVTRDDIELVRGGVQGRVLERPQSQS